MEREMRMRLFVEEYSKLVNLFEDIVQMRQSMGRLELYMIVMVAQVGIALGVGGLIMCIHLMCKNRKSGEYKLEHRFERRDQERPSIEKKQLLPPS
ncbi:hypothetical protein PRIPAC_88785 [Pristionchus pacificus]|uniref:Uncharacterized protein n=1 Tax=Pristionchus pacificus TaxID=54126 RepID=A0A2A6B419_PRIPA|nr:hypothetical protein PRIPAC_88785 [Pristionchus pacificus]|eukprot:PDM60626.1 hypothetical protein PRIPAC_52088 [Pristionchus pacificus]